MNNRTVLLLGATGLVGGHCLELLLKDNSYSQIITLTRRKLEREDSKLVQHITDFNNLSDYASLINAQDVFCCLGTTIKAAGSQEAFRKVDYVYPLEIARMASERGAEQFLIVTALGANAKSSVFYNRVKGEIEDAVRELPFKSVQIFRPSLLLGDRNEARFGEKAAELFLKLFKFVLVGSLRKYRAVKAYDVAHAMVRMAKAKPTGTSIYESDKIKQIARYGRH